VIPGSHLPEYVERGGQQVWRPPASARQVDLYGFVIAADRACIDSLLQRDLVHPSGAAVDYRCAHHHLIVTFGTIGRECSLDPIDSKRGYIAEREVSVWCLAADMHSGRLLWYLPYIFTDSEQTVATGREIFGYPKQLAYFDEDYPSRLGPAGGVTTVRGLAIDPFGPDQPATMREMLSIKRTPGGRGAPGESSIVDELGLFFPDGPSVNASMPHGRAARPSGKILPHGSPPPPAKRPAAPWIQGMFNAIEGRTLTGDPSDLIVDMVTDTTLVFLKQFRDVSCATKACYQAVVEAPIQVDPVGASYERLDASGFELTVQSWASDPIADELGIAAGAPIVPERAFRASFGFDILLGLEVWRAPT
jgi:hypothetical protein